jgi:hypothetical protein
LYVQSEDIIEEQTDLQGLMMVSIHGPNDSEFDFRTAMNIREKLRKRQRQRNQQKIKTFEKNCDEISFAKEIYKRKKN